MNASSLDRIVALRAEIVKSLLVSAAASREELAMILKN